MKGMDRKKSRESRGQQGQSMVEIAFLMPMFLALVLGTIELARLWGAKHSLTIAAREGARVLVLPYGAGLTYTTDAEVRMAAKNTATSYMNNSGIPVAASTKIIPIRTTAGPDNIMGTKDDVVEKEYSNGQRGDRVGFLIQHRFDTPLAAVLGMVGDANTFSNLFTITAVCLLDHE
jgi:hypothetical protein